MSVRLIFVLMILGFAKASWCQQSVRTADAACAGCHADIYRKYLATPMANASGLAVDHMLAGDFVHDASGVRYKIFEDKNQVWLSFSDGLDPRIRGQRQLQYFLGSGHLGVTYLYTQENYLLESPVAWYAATKGYDMKPGFARLTEMPPAIPMEPACLRCHMSGVAHVVPGTINRYVALPFQQTGITCESCHGDASAHLKTGGKAAIINPAKLNPERRDSICISCHLEGDVSVERAGHSAVDYKPGESIAEYISYFVFESKDLLSRGVSEVEQFGLSRCKRASGDRMSCMSCHDPHWSPAPEERVSFYRAKCLQCHNEAAFARTHHPETPDCTGCHMARNAAQNIPHVAWTDHRILRDPQPMKLRTLEPKSDMQLVALYSPLANNRDAALALYEAVLRGKSKDRRGATAKLNQVYAAGERDPRVLEGLGVLSGLDGDSAESQKRLKELLEIEPLNLTATADFGVLMARQGKTQMAIDLWYPAFTRNQDVIGLARNLAEAQCVIGDEVGAQKTITDALKFSPGVREVWTFQCKKQDDNKIPH
jgi:predicted CXXCH cytochrome family protein